MFDEFDLIEFMSTADGSTPQAFRSEPPQADALDPEQPALHPIHIERDLAVMLIGSSAGRKGRIKPHDSIARDATGEELSVVSLVMSGFLADEMKRTSQDARHRPQVHVAAVTMRQAQVLKTVCLRYAAYLRRHIQLHSGHRTDRSRYRLEQTMRAIEQLNKFLALPFDDVRTFEDCLEEVMAKARNLVTELTVLQSRAEAAGRLDAVQTLLRFRDAAGVLAGAGAQV